LRNTVLYNGYQGDTLPQGKVAVHEGDSSHQPITIVKSAWSYTFTSSRVFMF